MLKCGSAVQRSVDENGLNLWVTIEFTVNGTLPTQYCPQFTTTKNVSERNATQGFDINVLIRALSPIETASILFLELPMAKDVLIVSVIKR